MACRVTTTLDKASEVETAARTNSYASEVQTAVARRQLRQLTVESSTDSSVVQHTRAQTSSPTMAPTKSATSPDDFGSAAVAGNFAIGAGPGAFTWLAVMFAAAIHFRM